MACCKGAPYILYKVTCCISGKAYIGITKHFLYCRWKRHLYDAQNSKGHSFQRAIRKYGKETFTPVILYESEIAEEMASVERGAIAAHGTFAPHGYNQSSGGEFKIGWKMTPELRATRKPMLGKKHTPEAREKIAVARRGKKLSPERVEQIRQYMTGRKQSPESIEKSASKRRGIPKSPEARLKMRKAKLGVPRTISSIEKGRKALIENWKPRRLTHCVRGHEYTAETTYRHRDGSRECLSCMRGRYARQKAKSRATTPDLFVGAAE